VNGEGTKTEGQTEASDVIDDEVLEDPEATVVLTEVDTEEDLSETVVDLDVEAMVAKIENSDDEELAKKREAKKRLDELQEKLDKDDEFGSTYAFDLDDDLTT
jgi:hypothetical protein